MRERILDAAEAQLRRHGPAKTTVSDVARALGMSHANVYRHFESKAALQDAVAERWLSKVSDPLDAFVTRKGAAARRLEGWVQALAEAKRRKVLEDPELFAAYHAVAEAAREVVAGHLATLLRQVTAIIADGIRDGEFKVKDPAQAARAVLSATIRFHHPHMVRASAGMEVEADIKAVMKLVIAGLKVGVV
ncbi:MAG TPA: TetR family transcriptional regulator [Hypericibacter adhaerens]|uniref:TetR family transcriptional regulator n=1 Tax=Hypericibacter adhaerens TaxID=2602016 RepID=UPI002CC8E2E2|nr:TetR family transcriptional regulator [Hypericibacter adhaerens]HWA42135.1 TetR family transcriptional regulator [Hypericibacter adhaerens]